jgi:hypothetical protein
MASLLIFGPSSDVEIGALGFVTRVFGSAGTRASGTSVSVFLFPHISPPRSGKARILGFIDRGGPYFMLLRQNGASGYSGWVFLRVTQFADFALGIDTLNQPFIET